MPRPLRVSKGGIVYHVFNRANACMAIFENKSDYQAFENVIAEAHERRPIRIIDYCIMLNHWHMVFSPEQDDDLSAFLGWLTMTHTAMACKSRNYRQRPSISGTLQKFSGSD